MKRSTYVVVGAIAAAAIALFLLRGTWLPWLGLTPGTPAASEDKHADHGSPNRVKLSPQARDNLKLVTKPLVAQSYWRTLQVPGSIVDRPGVSDRGVPSPVAGIVTKVHAYPGDTVRPGAPLFSIRLISEYLQNSQTELFKAARELELNDKLLEQAQKLFSTGTLEKAKVVEIENQRQRLTTQLQAQRQDLLTRGLTPDQIDAAAKGQFVRDVVVSAPQPTSNSPQLVDVPTKNLGSDFAYEIQEMKVHLGEQVQSGQVLSILANHRQLYIEGRAFKKEAPLLERAAQQGWQVEAEFTEDSPNEWPPIEQKLAIRHLANAIDPASRTFGFFIPLENQSRAYEKDGQTHLVWRFRPGQRVRLHVPVEEFKDVFVLPIGAVVRDGLESYVFRQNGDTFERTPVRVVFEDRRNVALANDGSLYVGAYVAQGSAAALNRALNAQKAGEGGHAEHAGHSHSH